MENNEKLVKVYSNNSKKSRLKRNKNKFQRIWDAEKQKYVKVRKNKFAIAATKQNIKKDEDVEKKMNALKRRQKVRKKKSVPVIATHIKKPVAKQKPETKKAPVVHGKATTITMWGKKLTWDSSNLRYKEAA